MLRVERYSRKACSFCSSTPSAVYFLPASSCHTRAIRTYHALLSRKCQQLQNVILRMNIAFTTLHAEHLSVDARYTDSNTQDYHKTAPWSQKILCAGHCCLHATNNNHCFVCFFEYATELATFLLGGPSQGDLLAGTHSIRYP